MAAFSDLDIQRLYRKLLKREAHARELEYWHANATTLAQLREGIRGSTEYKARVEPIKDRALAVFLGAVAAGLYLLLGLLLALMLNLESRLVALACIAFGPAVVGAGLLITCLPSAELYLFIRESRRAAAAKGAQGEDKPQERPSSGAVTA